MIALIKSSRSVWFALAVALASAESHAAICHVNSRTGNNLRGDGTEGSPFKSISRASAVCRAFGDTIKVYVADPYDSAIERFPIRLASGVTLLGISKPVIGGSLKPVVQGGGHYEVPGTTYVRNVSVLITSTVAIVRNLRFVAENEPGTLHTGTSILCYSSSPVIEDNQFGGKAHAGVSTFGRSYPAIRGNLFRKTVEGALDWGVTVYDESEPAISGNEIFVNSGILAVDETRPVIHDNTIDTYRNGIVVEDSSRSWILDNDIFGNRDYGIKISDGSLSFIEGNQITGNRVGVLIANGTRCPIVDLGGAGESDGGNEFDNAEWQLMNLCSHDISAEDNTWPHRYCDEIGSFDIYDHTENPASGSVTYTPCLPPPGD